MKVPWDGDKSSKKQCFFCSFIFLPQTEGIFEATPDVVAAKNVLSRNGDAIQGDLKTSYWQMDGETDRLTEVKTTPSLHPYHLVGMIKALWYLQEYQVILLFGFYCHGVILFSLGPRAENNMSVSGD